MEKSTNKVHASILTAAAWDEWLRLLLIHDDVIASVGGYVCSPDFLQLVRVVGGKLSVKIPISPPKSPLVHELNAAEHTLSMAKLLHDLANAERPTQERIQSVRGTNMSRSKQFFKAFLSASKELLDKKATLF
ncbi:hypothetical protein AC1031_011470 [Aphanomyces cochlioides]|nr:hypothetical protein AC1031_011470 [Aphanomyces cochlioides]